VAASCWLKVAISHSGAFRGATSNQQLTTGN
jgi:hypothetical protein